jgi:FMN phosphatase YigB (HAD superfamily)
MTPWAVGFDLGDTLCEYAGVPLDWDREYPAALRLVAGACSCEFTPGRLASGVALLRKYNSRITPRPEEVEYPAESIFAGLLEVWDVPAQFLDAAVSAFFEHFRQRLRVFPESGGVLRQLGQRGVPLGILTDVPYGMPQRFVDADLSESGLFVPELLLITSTMIGRRKPHRAGFEALAERLGVARSRLVYVGNERKDVDGANKAGCRSVLLCRSGQPPAWGQWLTIRSLDELLTLNEADV